MRKKTALCLVLFFIFVSFGVANATDVVKAKAPEQLVQSFEAAFGMAPDWGNWILFAPELNDWEWTSYLIVSNYSGSQTNVSCQFTNFSAEQTTKNYTLPGFGKIIRSVKDAAGSEDVFDIWCVSGTLTGAIVLVMDTGSGKVEFLVPPLVFAL